MAMLVTVKFAAFFSALGFVAWILGNLWDMKGIAVIGGALVLVLGGMITIDGMSYRSGVETDHNLTVVNETNANGTDVEVAANATSTEVQYQRLSGPLTGRIGFIVLFLGAVLTIRGLQIEV